MHLYLYLYLYDTHAHIHYTHHHILFPSMNSSETFKIYLMKLDCSFKYFLDCLIFNEFLTELVAAIIFLRAPTTRIYFWTKVFSQSGEGSSTPGS